MLNTSGKRGYPGLVPENTPVGTGAGHEGKSKTVLTDYWSPPAATETAPRPLLTTGLNY